MSRLRGLEQKHEHGAQEMVRDTRPLGVRISDFFSNPSYVVVILGTLVAGIIFTPALFDVLTILALLLFWFCQSRKHTLPFKLPMVSHAKDYNDCIPGTVRPRKAGGIAFFGNEKITNK